jgi:predicted ATPase
VPLFIEELTKAIIESGAVAEAGGDAREQLVNAEIIFQRGNPPDAEYAFKHALLQDAAYSTLLRSRRQQLHSKISAVLESRFPEIVATQPEQLAHHCAEAHLLEKAVAYRLSIKRWAMKEAVAQLRKGLALLSRTDSTQRREQELDLQVTLGNALISTKGHSAPEPGQALARARELCQELNRPPKLGLLAGQCEFHFTSGELERARQHAGEIRLHGETTNDILWKRGGLAHWCGLLLAR